MLIAGLVISNVGLINAADCHAAISNANKLGRVRVVDLTDQDYQSEHVNWN
jgi:hypothetical protein